MKIKLCISMLAPFVLTAGNLVFNGSFELGTDGFALEKNLRLDTNPKLEFKALTTAEGAPGAGKRSLKIENPYAENYNLFSKEFPLKAETVYRVSFRMRASVDQIRVWPRIIKVEVNPRSTWTCHGLKVRFTLSKDWREYSYKFTIKNPKDSGFYHFNLLPSSQTAADIFIDDLRVTEENAAAEDKVDAIAVSDRNLYLKGDKAGLTLKLSNPTEKPFNGPVTVAVTDEYTKKTVFKTEFPMKLEPGETRQQALDAPELNRYGGFRVTVSGEGLRTHDGFFAVFGPYEAKPFDPASDHVVGLCGGTNLRTPLDSKSPYYSVWNSPLERKFEIYALMGCRILRDHDGGSRGVDWFTVQKEKGKFDFSRLDFQMDLYKKYNITYFPVIGNSHGFPKKPVPEWVNYTKQPDVPNCVSLLRGKVYLPGDEEYYNYIHETAKHLKGKVPFYEITNEPNLYLSPENYVRELRIAHDAIRNADPAAKIVGFCMTSDFGVNGSPWLKECAALGGLKYADVFSFHPYSSRQLGSINPADQGIANLRDDLKSYGKPGMPLWNTELYYLADGAKREVPPNCIVTRFLIDLGEGIGQSTSLHEGQIWKPMLTPNMIDNGNLHERIPSEHAAACNAMARLFERAKCVGKYRYDDLVICYVFRDQNKKLIAAIWNYQGKTGLRADLAAFRVMDFFGNPEKPEVKLLKDNVPYFLTPGNMGEQEFLEKIRDLKPFLDNPVSVGELGRLSGDTLFVMLHNASDKPVAATLGLNGKGLIARKSVKTEVPAKGKVAVEIPVRIKDADVKDAVLVLKLNGNFFRREIKIVRNPVIDGAFEGKNFKGTLNFGNGEIRMSLTVQDASDAGPTGRRNAWETDCVELFFDADPLLMPERFAQNYTADTFRLFITPRDGRLTAQGINPAVCKHSVKCEKDSYTVELSFPAKTGKYLGFECKIDDFDAAGKRVGETQIGEGAELYKKRGSFGLAKEK